MRALVTGGDGFIGSHLVERLCKEGMDVSALVRKKDNELVKHPERMAEIYSMFRKNNVKVLYGDLLDKRSLEVALKGIDVVFHLAAIARPMAIKDQGYFDTNETGTRNLLEACLEENTKKIILMSSVSAVGMSMDGKAVNEKTIPQPADVYGESKLAAEKIAKHFKKLNIVILRPPMVYGPRDYEMLRLFKTVNKGIFPIKSPEEPNLEFCYVGNIAEACVLAWKKGKKSETYHITDGEHYTIKQVTEAIAEACDKKLSKFKLPGWFFKFTGYFAEAIGFILRIHPPFKHNTIDWMTKKMWYSDCGKAKKELGYRNFISLEEGTRRTAEWYRKHGLL